MQLNTWFAIRVFSVIQFINFEDKAYVCSQTLGKEGAKSRDMAFLNGHVHIPRKSGDTKTPTPVTILYPSSIMKLWQIYDETQDK